MVELLVNISISNNSSSQISIVDYDGPYKQKPSSIGCGGDRVDITVTAPGDNSRSVCGSFKLVFLKTQTLECRFDFNTDHHEFKIDGEMEGLTYDVPSVEVNGFTMNITLNLFNLTTNFVINNNTPEQISLEEWVSTGVYTKKPPSIGSNGGKQEISVYGVPPLMGSFKMVIFGKGYLTCFYTFNDGDMNLFHLSKDIKGVTSDKPETNFTDRYKKYITLNTMHHDCTVG